MNTNGQSTVGGRKRKAVVANASASLAKKGKYYALNIQANKPTPFGRPPVHSDVRQSLCEALPYYRAYQSGAYHLDGVVHGFLCDKEASRRAKFDDQIMIATTGGGRVENEDGKMVISKDNDGNTFSRAFIKTKDGHFPVGVIAGQGNPICPSKLPSYYCVLDFFHVTDVWPEMTTENTEDGDPKKRWLVRLEKIDLSRTSWWAPMGSPSPPPQPDFVTKASVACCLSCRHESKTIYNAGWVCVNSDCLKFFNFGKNKKIDHDTLDISADFIRERTQYQGPPPGPLRPALPTFNANNLQTQADAVKLGKAIVCPHCLVCIPKLRWYHWECQTPGCGFTHTVLPPPITIQDALMGSRNITNSMTSSHANVSRIKVRFGAYDTDIYALPDPQGNVCGFVAHFKANATINQRQGGPDDIFGQMQDHVLNLKRGIVKGATGGTTQMLTNHYAANWGAPYKWHVKHVSTSFANSPDSVIAMKNRLSYAGDKVAELYNQSHLGADFVDFNEVLTVGYKELNKMGYHDDGEKELGPTVASISLGCSATMMWRPKLKAWGDLRPKKAGKPRAAPKSLKKVSPSQNSTAKVNNPAHLKIVLRHGDMMVMHGAPIQANYEHAVDPHGKLRFAVTARHVKIASLPAEIQDAALASGSVPANRQPPAYNGQ